ncbi:MAG: hypothetical protein Q9211_003196 [Gyalolechia sp. 1 TL-2023]
MAADHFNWLYLIYLLICGVLSILFLFYFNRLFASLVSYAVRTYIWRQYHVYIHVQALQFSLLGGRCFFKGFRYHGHNETVLINDGYITWRYWLRRVRAAEVLSAPSVASQQEKDEEGQNHSTQSIGNRPAVSLPCRIKLKLRGVEWYIYNRTPAYDAVKKNILDDGKPGSSASKSSWKHSGPRKTTRATEKNGTLPQRSREELSDPTAPEGTWTEKTTAEIDNSGPSDSEYGESCVKKNSLQVSGKRGSLPAFLRLLPIKIECSKAAIVIGNREVPSALIVKVDAATGQVDARRARSIDLYKQIFEFDFVHPVIELKPNYDRKFSRDPTTGVNSSREESPYSSRGARDHFHTDTRDKSAAALATARGVNHKYKTFFHSLLQAGSNRNQQGGIVSSHLPGEDHWVGLTRYLDDEDNVALEQERWRSIEYGEHPTIVDSPKIAMSLHWDVPGPVPESVADNELFGDDNDINGDAPPDWAVELRIYGGQVSYGPWADRLRQDLQPMFFPNTYTDATPAERLLPGQSRTSTIFRLNIDVEQSTTLIIPTRESSKDWKWREELAMKGKVYTEQNTGKSYRRKKKHEKLDAFPSGRPYGWLDVEIQPDSTITFAMDMVARPSGYRNSLDLDVKGPRMSSSVNHGLLLSAQHALISCDLSNPLRWSDMRQWTIAIDPNGLELFLLRDHVFLLTDIMNDWSAGPPANFHTFVPFTYKLDLRFTSFSIYLNANDSNVINSPASTEENTFVTVWADKLVASIHVPLKSFRPLRTQITFDIDAQNGGFKFSRPPWNTQHVFVKSSEVATMQDLKIDGSYDYYTSTSPNLTDVLRMNVHGISPKIHLYGFLIRAFMRIKDNYFGENIHFRTLEEYQGQISQRSSSSPSGDMDAQRGKISNDLDVILSITAVTTEAKLPSYLYSSAENVLLDIPSLGLELRFTNYYMDLDIAFSPITVSYQSLSSPEGQTSDKISGPQVFIDGVEIRSHRLFGLQPAEPTYVCNWDFDIGAIIGECSVSFVRLLSSALTCFSFAFNDAENALQPLSLTEIHDVTYVRAHLKLLRVWMVTDEAAFLLNFQRCNFEYNDLAKPLFSERLHMELPSFAMALVNICDVSADREGPGIQLRPYAFLESALELSMLHRRYDFEQHRNSQQHHITLHDSRTNRTPWLLNHSETMQGSTPDHLPKLTAPAMPFPSMPVPLNSPDSSTLATGSAFTDSSAMANRPTAECSKNESTFRFGAGERKPSTGFDAKAGRQREPYASSSASGSRRVPTSWIPIDASDNHSSVPHAERHIPLAEAHRMRGGNAHVILSASSSYKVPYFRLQHTSLDLSEVPPLARTPVRAPSWSASQRSPSDANDEDFPRDQQQSERTSFFVDLCQGVRGFFKPQSLKVLRSITEKLQVQEPESLLDQLQIDALDRLPGKGKGPDYRGTVTEAQIRLSNSRLRIFEDTQGSPFAATTDISCDLDIDQCIVTARRWNKVSPEAGAQPSEGLSAYIMLNHADMSVMVLDRQTQQDHAAVQFRLLGTRLWGCKAAETDFHARFKDFEVNIAMMKPESIPLLVRSVDSLSKDIGHLQNIGKRQSARLRQLVLSLTIDGQETPDPPFLTRASYVLRIANSHLRASESWRIASRLRYVYHLLPVESQAKVRSWCFNAPKGCPGNAREAVVAIFGRMGMWNGDDVKESVLLDEVFGRQVDKTPEHSASLAVKISVKAGNFRLLLQPGKTQTQVHCESMAFELMLRQLPLLPGVASTIEGLANAQLYLSKTTLTLNFGILSLLQHIIVAIADQSKEVISDSHEVTPSKLAPSSYRIYFVSMSEENTIALDSPSLRVLSLCRSLSSSAVVHKTKDRYKMSTNFLVCAETATMEVLSHSQIVSTGKVDRPSLFGNLEGEGNNAAPNSWHLATSCTDISLKVLEDPPSLLAIVESVLLNEVASIEQIMKREKPIPRMGQSEPAVPANIALGRPHVALFLDSYLISYKVLAALSYRVTGKVGRISIRPGSRRISDMVLDFDLKEHSHAFLGHTGVAFEMISELVIPPINSHVVVGTNPLHKDVSIQSTIEHIFLDAAAVHALLATLSHPEITELASSIHRDSSRLTRHYKPTSLRKDSASNSTQVPQPFMFDASITLVGLGIHTNTAKDTKKRDISQLHFELGHVHIKGSNRAMSGKGPLKFPELFVNLRGLRMGFKRSIDGQEHPCGEFTLGATLQATAQPNVRQELVRAYQVHSSRCESIVYTETASVLIDVLDNLRNSFRDIDITNEVKGLQRLRRVTLADLDPREPSQPAKVDEAPSTALFSAMYSLELRNMRIIWRVGESIPLSSGREAEDLVLSSTKINLATCRDNAARLLIQGFQLQMVPTSQTPTERSLNSALLPEVVFNVAYMSTEKERRLAVQAAGKSLDLHLTSQFIIPATNIRRSIAIAVDDVRAIAGSKVGSPVENRTQRPDWLKHKRLTSVLIDADFAGAVVYIHGRSIADPESRAIDLLHGRRVPQQGRYGQFTQDHAGSNTTLRAPGVAVKVEYRDFDVENKSFNAEVKVDASSNVLYPSVVPLVLEISSSVKEVVGEPSPEVRETALKPSTIKHRPSASKLTGDERLKTADPSVIFRNSTLNLGLRICRQDFTMSCQPIARVAATAQIDNIYVTANTVQSKDHGQSFTLSGSFSGLQTSVQHTYSRDPTAGLEVQAIVISLMNSKHLGAANGISAITRMSPLRMYVNAKQSQDFLLFREIWLPADIRKPAPASAPSAASEPQAYIVQRYQQIASAAAFPWDATLSVAKLDFQVDLGQSLGKSDFSMSGVWVSSKKLLDWEQNLCLGMGEVSLESTGRMSGFVTVRGVEVRTTIRWPVTDQVRHHAPLIQASIGFESIRVKAAFEYQAFAVAHMSGFKFLMYNVRDHRSGNSDRLLGAVDVGTLRAFCTTTSASQALALYQAFERLIQEKHTAYEASLKESEKFLRRRSTAHPMTLKSIGGRADKGIDQPAKGSLRLQTKVMVSFGAMNVGVFPNTFFDTQVFKVEALDASAQFAVSVEKGKLHSVLALALGQLQVALSGVTKQEMGKSVGEVLPEDVIRSVSHSRGGTILTVPKVVATMRTWQSPGSNDIQYIFKSAFQGKVDVGWNYSRIGFLRGMWNSHVRALAARLGKPLPQSALQISTGLDEGDKGGGKGPGQGGQGREKITAVVNVPQSKYQYTPLESPVIETPQLRDMGEATPPLEWIGLQRERLPNLTHQIVIVALLKFAREVDDAYSTILGSS